MNQGRADARIAAAERELQGFSYIVSHDLAASFRHVSEFSRLLVGELGGGLTGRQRDHAEHVRAAVEKCQLMMEQLLVFSRAQQKPLEMARFDAGVTLTHALGRLDPAELRSTDLTIEPLGEVFGDPELIGQVVSRLLDNAVKFQRPGVRGRITVLATQDRRYWRLRVRDNGVGVEVAYREKAFQMFQHLTSEGFHAGVGAGLAICRRIARRHEGDVTFIDCEDGACVELTLPRAPLNA